MTSSTSTHNTERHSAPHHSGKATVSLPSDTQILITRHFDAPRALLWRAWTTPELVKKWWAGQRGQVTSAEIDLRVGGSYRYVLVANEGFEVGFHGEFSEIVDGEKIVKTEIFEGAPDGVAVNTDTFADAGGGTQLSVLVDCPDQQTRDMIVASGMEDGMQESYDALETVAGGLAAS
ncbi:ATPase [Nakamurella sp. YIM 132087]|uniref:ATPase n=1 Tax=Nakamurella alba TaxID=2665158 RepID=A0A7K1FL21_9ACTN|nr:SRPBCC family protein [Nakamurella alba]MTD14808.1 ATPase [Nakamurella alba]